MEISPDGTFFLEKGETVPYFCPIDGWPIPYEALNKNVMLVHCLHCGFVGTEKQFTRNISALPPR